MSVTVHHAIDGPADGPVVVLSNSIGSDLRMWEPQVKPLTDNGFRVIRYDTRGHGRSPVPPGPYRVADLGGDLLALLDSLSLDRVHLVGLSVGGMTGMWLGQNAPERLRSLVLCCTSARPGNPRMWHDRAARVRVDGMADIAAASIGRWMTEAWRTANPERAAMLQEMTARTPAEGYASCCEALAELDLVPGLAGIDLPTTVISGAQDLALPPAHGRLIAEHIPGARYEEVDQAAHLGNYEQPARFSELILQTVKGQR